MSLKTMTKRNLNMMARNITALVVMMAICIGSVITVMAQTVEVTIVDNGEQTSVSMMDPSEESVLKTAVERQLVEPVDGDDQVVFNEEENTLTIRRGLTAEVAADGTTRTVKLYYGDTVAEAVEDSGFTLGENDVLTVDADTILR